MFKYIVFIFLFVCQSLYAQEELFTCTDIDSGGFYYNGSEYQLTLFNLGQFDMKIDFENNSLQSDSPNMFFAEPNCLDNSEVLTSKEYHKNNESMNVAQLLNKEI